VIDQLSRFVRTPKGLLCAVFLALLVPTVVATGIASLAHVAWAVAGAVVVDLAAGHVSGKDARRWPSSAILSGLIVAFVLGVETPGLVAAAVGALSSASKYLLRSNRGHVFNPAGLALLAAVPLFSVGESWWGAFGDMPAAWVALLVGVGALVVDKVNKWPMALSFLGVLYGLFTVLSFGQPALVAEMYRAPFIQSSLFLAFFMLTDPPTSPGKASDQVWMGGLAGLVAALAQLVGAGQVYLLVGLLAVNVALTAQRWLADRRRSSPGSGAVPGALRGAGHDRLPFVA
jgi:Na+-translocating ferredoxin:NAD+ oxidoreductase RnfD subunit